MIFHRVRLHTDSSDLGVLVQQVREDIDSGICTEQDQQQLQHQFPYIGSGSEASSPMILPPLRSVIEVPQAETTSALDRPSGTALEDAYPFYNDFAITQCALFP